jgi:uncharacterized protein
MKISFTLVWSVVAAMAALSLCDCATTTGPRANGIYSAALAGDVERLSAYADKGGNLSAPDADGYTLLHYAVRSGKADAVTLLIDKGAITDALDRTGWPPLAYAVIRGDEAMIRCLLSKGADPDAGQRVVPLLACVFRTGRPIGVGLMNVDASRVLDALAKPPRVDNLKILLAAEKSKGTLTFYGNRIPLLWSAIAFGSADVVRTLLDSGEPANFIYSGIDTAGWANIWDMGFIVPSIKAVIKKREEPPIEFAVPVPASGGAVSRNEWGEAYRVYSKVGSKYECVAERVYYQYANPDQPDLGCVYLGTLVSDDQMAGKSRMELDALILQRNAENPYWAASNRHIYNYLSSFNAGNALLLALDVKQLP